MALSIIAQAVNAVSAPCPMLDAAMSHDDHKMMMDMPVHDMSSMTDDTSKAENCCGEESCPMNTFVVGFIFAQLALTHTDTISPIENTERVHLYLSRSTASLYRPPIFA